MPESDIKTQNSLRDMGFYDTEGICEAMVEHAKNKEIGLRYGDSFGKRPDVLSYSEDVRSGVRQGATSFHASEELWVNPKLIRTEGKKGEREKIIIGWDLVIDVDIPDWKLSKITSWLIIRALKDFGISAISVKFSGNKGFHIAVPFESFPERYGDKEVRLLFPEAPRAIALHLLNYIAKTYAPVEDNDILFGKGLEKIFRTNVERLAELTGKPASSFIRKACRKCGKAPDGKEQRKMEFACPRCESAMEVKEAIRMLVCPKCNEMLKMESKKEGACQHCGNQDPPIAFFDPLSIIEVDTILISSRHLYRMPYSMHEKSGLVSFPFNPDKILNFEKKYANPKTVKVSPWKFIDRAKAKAEEASRLLDEAMKAQEKIEREKETKEVRDFQPIENAIPEPLFPPSIKKMLGPLEDGKKRALFVLTNFLVAVGWDYDMIEKRLEEWNKAHPEPLREQVLKGHLSHHKRSREKILPPNYDKDYYKGINITPTPEELRFKNPVTYAIAQVEKGNNNKDSRKHNQKK